MNKAQKAIEDIEANRDPITGEPGSHPIGTGIGAAALGTVGAMAGVVGGPLGIVAGAALGASAGAALGHNLADNDDEERLEVYERIEPNLARDFPGRTYATHGDYDSYRPAYRYGAQTYGEYGHRDWDDKLEAELRTGWEKTKDSTRMGYERASEAIKDAWHAAGDAIRR